MECTSIRRSATVTWRDRHSDAICRIRVHASELRREDGDLPVDRNLCDSRAKRRDAKRIGGQTRAETAGCGEQPQIPERECRDREITSAERLIDTSGRTTPDARVARRSPRRSGPRRLRIGSNRVSRPLSTPGEGDDEDERHGSGRPRARHGGEPAAGARPSRSPRRPRGSPVERALVGGAVIASIRGRPL